MGLLSGLNLDILTEDEDYNGDLANINESNILKEKMNVYESYVLINEAATNTTAILKTAYPECEKKIQKNLSKYKKWVSDFMAARIKQLYSNMPTEQIYFTATDRDNFFKATGIDITIIRNAIKNTYYGSIANFNPRYAKDECTIAMLCLVRYFNKKNSPKELDFALITLSFSGKMYPSLWYRSFPTAPPQEHIMDYVVNNMCSAKFDIVREGNVIGAVRSQAKTWLNTYQDRFNRFNDDDVQYLVQQLHNRIGSFIINLATLYYDAYENKNLYITYDSDDMSEDNYHLADSDIMKLERIVSTTMEYMATHDVNYKLCKVASNNDVKMDELKDIIANILANPDNTPLIREYITLMVATFFQQSSKKEVMDIDFVTYSIKPKPNSKDKYIVREKELLDQILINNSEHFQRRRRREATQAAYYRSINSYFALAIQEAQKK